MPRILRNLNSSDADWSGTLGTPYVGVLGSLIPATGEHGPGYAYDALVAGDETREIRGRITRWPTNGTLTAYEDTSFEYVGTSDTFDVQIEVDGVPRGSEITHTITIGAEISLAGRNTRTDHTTTSGAISQTHILAGANTRTDHTTTSGSLTPTTVLSGANTRTDHTTTSGAISQVHVLSGRSTRTDHTTTSGAIVVATGVTLAGLNTRTEHLSGTGPIAQTHNLAGRDTVTWHRTTRGAWSGPGAVPMYLPLTHIHRVVPRKSY